MNCLPFLSKLEVTSQRRRVCRVLPISVTEENGVLLRDRGRVLFDLANARVGLLEEGVARELAQIRPVSRSSRMGRFKGEIIAPQFSITAGSGILSGPWIQIRHFPSGNEVKRESVLGYNKLPLWPGMSFESDICPKETVTAYYLQAYEELAIVTSAMLLLYHLESFSISG